VPPLRVVLSYSCSVYAFAREDVANHRDKKDYQEDQDLYPDEKDCRSLYEAADNIAEDDEEGQLWQGAKNAD